MKKSLTAAVIAALLISAPGPLAVQAVAQVVAAPASVAPLTSALGSVGSAPSAALAAPGLTAAPALGALTAPALPIALPPSAIPNAAASAAAAAPLAASAPTAAASAEAPASVAVAAAAAPASAVAAPASAVAAPASAAAAPAAGSLPQLKTASVALGAAGQDGAKAGLLEQLFTGATHALALVGAPAFAAAGAPAAAAPASAGASSPTSLRLAGPGLQPGESFLAAAAPEQLEALAVDSTKPLASRQNAVAALAGEPARLARVADANPEGGASDYEVHRAALRALAEQGVVKSLRPVSRLHADEILAGLSTSKPSAAIFDYDDTLAGLKEPVSAAVAAGLKASVDAGVQTAILTDRPDAKRNEKDVTILDSLAPMTPEQKQGLVVGADSGARLVTFDAAGAPNPVLPSTLSFTPAERDAIVAASAATADKFGRYEYNGKEENLSQYKWVRFLPLKMPVETVKAAARFMQDDLAARGANIVVTGRLAASDANPAYLSISLLDKSVGVKLVREELARRNGKAAPTESTLVVGDSFFETRTVDSDMLKGAPGALAIAVGGVADPRLDNIYVWPTKGGAASAEILKAVGTPAAVSNKDGANGGALNAYHISAGLYGLMGVIAAAVNPPVALAFAGIASLAAVVAERIQSARGVNLGAVRTLTQARLFGMGLGMAAGAVVGLLAGTSAVWMGAVAGVVALLASAYFRQRGSASPKDGSNGGFLTEIGLVAAGVAAITALGAMVSPSFRATLKRFKDIALGWFGLGAKKMETPEAMAERLHQQDEESERRFQEVVEQSAIQSERVNQQKLAHEKRAAELQKDIDALVQSSDPNAMSAAQKPQQELEIVNASLARDNADLKAAQDAVTDAQQERTRFKAEKAAREAELQSRLNEVERARFQGKLADLKQKALSGDQKKTQDRFDQAAQEEIAKGKGKATAVNTDPDEIARKARAESAEREARAKLEQRKKELAEQAAKKDGGNGGALQKSASASLAVLGALLTFLAPTGGLTLIAGTGLLSLFADQLVPGSAGGSSFNRNARGKFLAFAAGSFAVGLGTVLLGLYSPMVLAVPATALLLAASHGLRGRAKDLAANDGVIQKAPALTLAALGGFLTFLSPLSLALTLAGAVGLLSLFADEPGSSFSGGSFYNRNVRNKFLTYAAGSLAVGVGTILIGLHSLAAVMPAIAALFLVGVHEIRARAKDAAVKNAAAKDGANGGDLVATIGIGAAIVLVLGALLSPAFRATLKRYKDIALGWFGLGAKKMETPEAMAERLHQQDEESEKRFQEVVEQSAIQSERVNQQKLAHEKRAAELQKDIDALVQSSDPNAMSAAQKPQQELEIVNASLARDNADLKAAQDAVTDAQQERTRFKAEKAAREAELQSRLNEVERARFQGKLADLKQKALSGDQKKTQDRFDQAAQEEIAKGKGKATAVNTDPDEIARKARAESAERDARAKLEQRKKELAEQAAKKDGKNGGYLDSSAASVIVDAALVGLSLLFPAFGAGALLVMGILAFTQEPQKQKSYAKHLLAVAAIVIAAGAIPLAAGVHLGAVAGLTIGGGLRFAIPGALGVTMGLLNYSSARKSAKASVPAPAPAPSVPTQTAPAPQAPAKTGTVVGDNIRDGAKAAGEVAGQIGEKAKEVAHDAGVALEKGAQAAAEAAQKAAKAALAAAEKAGKAANEALNTIADKLETPAVKLEEYEQTLDAQERAMNESISFAAQENARLEDEISVQTRKSAPAAVVTALQGYLAESTAALTQAQAARVEFRTQRSLKLIEARRRFFAPAPAKDGANGGTLRPLLPIAASALFFSAVLGVLQASGIGLLGATLAGVGVGAVITAAAYVLTRRASRREAAASQNKDASNGGSIVEIGLIAAGAAFVAALFSPAFRATLKRYKDIVLGWFGLGAKKLETPEAMAERLHQQDEESEKRFQEVVEQSAVQSERVNQQMQAHEKRAAELQKDIDAILTDSDPTNDAAAQKPQQELDVVNAALARDKADLKAAQDAVTDAQQERTRFKAEKAAREAELQSRLNEVERARFQGKLADLKQKALSGDQKKTQDRFDQAAQEEIAKGKGKATAVNTDPDEIARKARAESAERDARAKLEQRKKELAEQAAKKDGKS